MKPVVDLYFECFNFLTTMKTLESTQLRKGVVFKEQNKVYLVLHYKHVKKGRGLATVRVKVRDVETGATVERTFSSNEKVKSIDLEHKSAQYLYSDKEDSFFMNSDDYVQFQIENSKVAWQRKFLIEGMKVQVLWLEDKVINVDLAKKVELTVKYTGPGVAGDTAGSATKEAELATGFKLQVPLFIKNGDCIIVNTDNGKYVSKG